MQETWAQSLGLEDPLEKGMAIHMTEQVTLHYNVLHYSNRYEVTLCSFDLYFPND